MPDLVGRTLKGRYRVEELLGEGLMGQVWRAQDTHRVWPVALKVMRPDYADDRDFLRYFEREAAALTRLQHPAIVRLYSFEQDTLEDGSRVAFLVLDFIKGRDLRRRLAETSDPLPLLEVLTIVRHICSALAYAHRSDMAHGDVKPANILLSEEGRAILSDFGIARLGSASSMSGQPMLGTPAYMAPECWQDIPADARSDLYSFGVLLYEMLGGRRPFRGETTTVSGSVYAKLRHEHLNEPPPSLRALNPDLSEGIETVVLKCLAKAPEQRYQSAEELLLVLEAAVGVVERFTLRVNAEPSGTQVFLNGDWRGAVPVTITNLPRNLYALRLTKTGYYDREAEVELTQDRSVTIELEGEGERTVPRQPPLNTPTARTSPKVSVAALIAGAGALLLLGGVAITASAGLIGGDGAGEMPESSPTQFVAATTPANLPLATPTESPVPSLTPIQATMTPLATETALPVSTSPPLATETTIPVILPTVIPTSTSIATATATPTVGVTPRPPASVLLLKAQCKEVYEVKENVRRWIPDQVTFDALGYRDVNVRQVSNGELEAYQIAMPIPSHFTGPYPEGMLLKPSNDITVYQIENGKRRRFPDDATFNNHGNCWYNIVPLPPLQVQGIPEGSPFTSAAQSSNNPTTGCSTIALPLLAVILQQDSQLRSQIGCPINRGLPNTSIAEELFQNGRMYWAGSELRQIFVLLNGGSWTEYSDSFKEGDPEKVGFRPPAGLFEPVRGLGKVWRTQLGGPQSQIGWATTQEHGYSSTIQQFANGYMLLNSDKKVVALPRGNQWRSY